MNSKLIFFPNSFKKPKKKSWNDTFRKQKKSNCYLIYFLSGAIFFKLCLIKIIFFMFQLINTNFAAHINCSIQCLSNLAKKYSMFKLSVFKFYFHYSLIKKYQIRTNFNNQNHPQTLNKGGTRPKKISNVYRKSLIKSSLALVKTLLP